MNRTLLSTLFVTLLGGTATADVMIHDNDQTVTVDCAKDPMVMISGNAAKITLTGTCKRVMVSGNKAEITGSVGTLDFSGNDNVATLDGVDTIRISGNDNKVSWKKTLNPKKKKPAVAAPGSRNSIAKTK